jgi:hypothetical protein
MRRHDNDNTGNTGGTKVSRPPAFPLPYRTLELPLVRCRAYLHPQTILLQMTVRWYHSVAASAAVLVATGSSVALMYCNHVPSAGAQGGAALQLNCSHTHIHSADHGREKRYDSYILKFDLDATLPFDSLWYIAGWGKSVFTCKANENGAQAQYHGNCSY